MNKDVQNKLNSGSLPGTTSAGECFSSPVRPLAIVRNALCAGASATEGYDPYNHPPPAVADSKVAAGATAAEPGKPLS